MVEKSRKGPRRDGTDRIMAGQNHGAEKTGGAFTRIHTNEHESWPRKNTERKGPGRTES